MSGQPPPRDKKMIEDGLSLSARLALGLLTAPLMGIALLSRPSREEKPQTDASSAPATAPTPETPVEAGTKSGGSPERPRRAEIENALHQLTEATLPKRTRRKQGAAPAAGSKPKPRSKSAAVKLH